ncbi:sirohydrochlorin chelatase [Mycolicibacterium pulveris]|uniref:Cobalamin biosynthesis protein CbiX n=1 Tax=Mycolicibacterium pulveris TaxID=36813 RepID=A0A7I7UH76_MYCPV|nr:sirohydrochlorin chelatase [Mycolicibacterium pulveris]MCV6979695.1 sirohydrochlorin chelatase [Mycolicibacterium pulveris]BBY80858.1 cobalamin biosynthesis protein CbiX [Mycolicibacterium pulveris]
MNALLVAHGTRKPSGVALVERLAQRVSAALRSPVRVAFVDVVGPTPSEVLRGLSGPTVVVPAFLACGYHVNVDIPTHVMASGHPDVTVTDPLGPSPQLARVLLNRLSESGWRSGDSVVLGAAGTSDLRAQSDLRRMATWLSALTNSRVELAFAAAEPAVADAVAELRARGARRVVVASYLLSDGLFQDRLRASGADVVTNPLGTHEGMVRLITSRFRHARLRAAA